LAVEKVEFLLQAIAGLLHLSFDELARRVVFPHPLKPSPAVEFDDRDPSVWTEILSEVGKIAYAVVNVVVGVAAED
jgi:hypothetical protein